MGQYPLSPRAAVLTFCQSHHDIWKDHMAQIGVSGTQLTAFENAWQAYQAAAAAQVLAKQTAVIATQNADGTFTDMKRSLSEVVRTIKAFAESSNDPRAVYTIADLVMPAPPSPALPPAQPTNIKVELNATTGALTLKWKAANPEGTTGTSYIIKRRLPGESAFSFIGVTGVKKFTDATFAAGPDSVEYTVQGQRSDATGPVSAIATVTFGQAPNGEANVRSVRMAA